MNDDLHNVTIESGPDATMMLSCSCGWVSEQAWPQLTTLDELGAATDAHLNSVTSCG